MKKIAIKKIYIILFSLIIIAGCSEDFLERKPIALEDELPFYTTQQAAEQAVTVTYSVLYPWEVMDVYYLIDFGSVGSDDAEVGGNSTSDQPDVQNIDKMLHNSSEGVNYPFFYGYMYKGIRMANTAAHFIPIIKNIDEDADTTVLNRLLGEALFFRAFYSFCLAQVYGGIVLQDKYIGEKDYTSEPRSSLKATYDFIEKNLMDAIPLLWEKGENGLEVGRINKSIAKAYLVKALVYESSYAKFYLNDGISEAGDDRFEGLEEKWHEAKILANELITSGRYDLVGKNPTDRYNSWWASAPGNTDGLIGGFRHLFTVDADNSIESIFEIQNTNEGLGFGLAKGNFMSMYTGPKFFRGVTGSRTWGWNCPTKYLADAFGNQDSRETGLNSTSHDPALDPRLATTIAKEGDSILCSINGQLAGIAWRPIICEDTSAQHQGSPTGMFMRKYEASPNEFYDTRGAADYNGPINLKLMRFADLLLMAAEAAYWDNDVPTAMDYVNRVRSRARASGNTGYPQDLTELSFEDIVHERRLELAMEGFRFYDLMRWNLGEKFINGISLGAKDPSYAWTVEFVKNKHEFFPIPATQVQTSGVKQNNNYE